MDGWHGHFQQNSASRYHLFALLFMILPKRSAPYIVGVLLIVLLTLVGWMFMALSAPELRQAVKAKASAKKEQQR